MAVASRVAGFDGVMAILERALEEDLRSGDVTSEACLGEEDQITGKLLLKQGGRLAGLVFLEPLFALIDSKVEVRLFVDEGSEGGAGTVIGTVSGPARAIFAVERVALNMVSHASGIATLTAAYVERVEGLPCDILDTRRTHPGLRKLEKYAVRVGGGVNHRRGLDDRFIIKHHHIASLGRNYAQPMREAVRRVRAKDSEMIIEIEVENLDMVAEALAVGADILLLGRIPLPMVRKAVKLVAGRAYIEVGGIPREHVRTYAEAGVNGIAVADLTFAAPPLSIGLRF